jgi:hypothetical protein
MALKIQLLNSRSVITMIDVAPVLDIGKSVMKSIDISLHCRSGIGSGFKKPRLFSLYMALLPQMSQLGKNRRTSCDKPGQVNLLLIIAFKRSRPGCPVRAES